MTITLVTNNIEDFQGGLHTATATYYDATYTDRAIYENSPTNSTQPLSIGHNVDVSAAASVSLHFDFYGPLSNSAASDGEWGRFVSPDGSVMVYLDFLDGNVRCNCYNAAGSSATGGSSSIIDGSVNSYDLIYEDDGANCTATLYQNETIISTSTLAAAGGKKMPVNMQFTHNDMFGASGVFAYSQIIFAHDESTVGMKLERLAADTIGFYTDMSATITEINDYDRGTGWSSGTATDKNSFNLPTYSTPAGRLIHSLNAQTTLRIGTTGPQNIRQFLRISSVDYAAAADYTPPAHQFGKHCDSWTTDPSTAVAWTGAGVAAAEMGFEAKT
jgi:hypothetical protein